MGQVYTGDLRIIGEYARRGAAAQAQRQNAELALEQANREQQTQLHLDALDQQAADRQASRQYELQDRRESRNADALLAQQKIQAGRLADERNHEQATELQDARQRHGFQMQAAREIDDDVNDIVKELNSKKYTPQGQALARGHIATLHKLREAKRVGWQTPAEWTRHMQQWIGEVNDSALENHVVQEQPFSDFVRKNAIDVRTGEPVDWNSPPKAVLIPRKDKNGNVVPIRIELDEATSKGKGKSSEPKTPAEYFKDPAVYDREAKAARERLNEQFRSSPGYEGDKSWTPEEVNSEILRHRAQHETFLGVLSGTAPVAPSAPPASQPAVPPAFTPNVSPATNPAAAAPSPVIPPAATQPASALGGSVPSPNRPVPEVDSDLAQVDDPVLLQTIRSDPQLSQLAMTAADGSTVLPAAAIEEAKARAASLGTDTQVPLAKQPEPTTAAKGTQPSVPLLESAIETGEEVKRPFGDSELTTRQTLKLANGERMAIAPIPVLGRRVRAAFTGNAWRILHVDPANGSIRPIGTLPGPGAGTKVAPITFSSQDAEAISAAVPKGTWLRDENGTLFENE